jgi:hypothetical protein
VCVCISDLAKLTLYKTDYEKVQDRASDLQNWSHDNVYKVKPTNPKTQNPKPKTQYPKPNTLNPIP